MKQKKKKQRIIIWISSFLILCIGTGGYLWFRNQRITIAKEYFEDSSRLLSEFHKQKTLYQKVDFLMHKLPDSDKKSLFCTYSYDRDFQDNGWRNANIISIDISRTTGKYDTDGYEVVCIDPLSSKESPQHRKNICSLLIKDKSDNYWLEVNNNWDIVECGISNSDKSVPKNQQKKLIEISKKNVDLLFKTVEKDMRQCKERTKKILKGYHVDVD